jgi:hypothetical protein
MLGAGDVLRALNREAMRAALTQSELSDLRNRHRDDAPTLNRPACGQWSLRRRRPAPPGTDPIPCPGPNRAIAALTGRCLGGREVNTV